MRPQFWHSQIPLSLLRRSSRVWAALWRGPPGEAAQICAATPTMTIPSCLAFDPTVARPQSGAEHRKPTALPISVTVFGEKLSRTLNPNSDLPRNDTSVKRLSAIWHPGVRATGYHIEPGCGVPGDQVRHSPPQGRKHQLAL